MLELWKSSDSFNEADLMQKQQIYQYVDYHRVLLHAINATIKVAGGVVLSSDSSEIEKASPGLLALAVVATTKVANPFDHDLSNISRRVILEL